MTQEELDKVVERINNIIYDGSMELSDINEILKNLHSSVRYYVIGAFDKDRRFKDIIRQARNNAIDGSDTNKLYQTYQDLKREANDMHKHDESTAKMKDVDRACMNVYTLLVKMIGALNQTLIQQGEAINKIEGKLGIDMTGFGGDSNDMQGNKGDNDGGAGVSK